MRSRVVWLVVRITSADLVSLGVHTTSIDGVQEPASVAIGDINQDGLVDVVTAFEDGINVYSFGDWTRRRVANATEGAFTIVAVGDVDGDADLDLVSAGDFDAILWHENHQGIRWPTHDVARGLDGTLDLQIVDYDGDDDIDVIVANFFYDTVSAYLNDGFGTFAYREISTMLGVVSAFGADVDGDTSQDVVASAVTHDWLVWYPHGEGAVDVNYEPLGIDDCWAADLDRDGAVDIVSAARATDEIAWHKNLDGNGTLWEKRLITTSAVAVRRVVVYDVLRGPYLDVFAANFGEGSVMWYTYDEDEWTETLVAAVPRAYDLGVFVLDEPVSRGAVVSIGFETANGPVAFHDLQLAPAPTPAPTLTPRPSVFPTLIPTTAPSSGPSIFDPYRPTRAPTTPIPSAAPTAPPRKKKFVRVFCADRLHEAAGACGGKSYAYLAAYAAVATAIVLVLLAACAKATYILIKPSLLYYEPYYMPEVQLCIKKWKKSCVRRCLCGCCPKRCKWPDDEDPLRPSDGVPLKAGDCPIRVVTDVPRSSQKIRFVKTGRPREVRIV